MSGLTQERCSEMPEGESGSWLEGISELTKSEGIQAVHCHYIKGKGLGQVLRTDLVSQNRVVKQMMGEIRKIRGKQ